LGRFAPGEFAGQQRSRAVQAGSDRSDGTLDHDCGFVVSFFFKVAEHHYFAVARGQGGDGLAEADGIVFVAVVRLLREGQVFNRNRAALLGVEVLQELARYADQEPAELAAGGIELFGMMNQPDERVLGNLGCFRSIRGHEQRKSKYGAMVFTIELGKRISISGAESRQEVAGGSALELRHDPG
jgi:hypothetical protein